DLQEYFEIRENTANSNQVHGFQERLEGYTPPRMQRISTRSGFLDKLRPLRLTAEVFQLVRIA
ncbi:hypothetical protein, partial [Paenibacillus tyrfis]|uniref:hypothetical protein n=1 Tax=Paenibacillus tyrfis TaxID=1501230 RepID=UPI001F47D135